MSEVASTSVSPPYRREVLVGPWQASRHLEKATRDKFVQDYEQGDTALQITRRMKANLLRPQALAQPDQLLRHGDVIQVVAPDMPAFTLAGGHGHLGVFLAGTVDVDHVDHCQFLTEGSEIYGSPHTEATARNSWRICAEDGSSGLDGSPLCLGQCFTLRAVESGTRCPLYVRALSRTTNEVGCGPPQLSLSTFCDTYCRWRALHVDKERRPETDGGTFPPNMRIVLQHAASQINLAASAGGKRNWVSTFFGQECKIGLKDYKDQYRQVMSENVWILAAQRLRERRTELSCPPPDLNPARRRPPTPPTPPDLCAVERACPLQSPHPEQRKSECPADMPCQRDAKCQQMPAPRTIPPPRPLSAACACPNPYAPTPCPPPGKCLRPEDLTDNRVWCSWQKTRG